MNSPEAKPKAVGKSRDALKVLVVDDDQFQLEIIAETLRSLGFRDITEATSGDQALAAINASRNENPFDLMLSDLHMPGMDGFQFLASVAQGGFSGALIIVSGQTSDVLHSAALVAKLRRFKVLGSIAKPVDKATLSAMVDTLG
jgi:CheY-like chemotaxis protein